MSLVLSNKGKGMQSSSEQPLVGEERYVTTRITAAKETRSTNERNFVALKESISIILKVTKASKFSYLHVHS